MCSPQQELLSNWFRTRPLRGLDKFCFRKFPKFPIASERFRKSPKMLDSSFTATILPEHRKTKKTKHNQRNQTTKKPKTTKTTKKSNKSKKTNKHKNKISELCGMLPYGSPQIFCVFFVLFLVFFSVCVCVYWFCDVPCEH